MPDWLFSPEIGDYPPRNGSDAHPNQTELLESISDRQKAIHDESSTTVRRIFYALVGTCIFCVLTLAGTADSQIVVKGSNVTLPILNYPIGFLEFLIVGPVLLFGLWVYLHIFLGEVRLQNIPQHLKQPTLPNFSGWGARIVVLLTLYWMVPFTFIVFSWKAWPSSSGQLLYYVTIAVAVVSVLLQMRRCPGRWRAWGLPLLALMFVVVFIVADNATQARYLNLYKQNFENQDLERAGLYHADLTRANLRSVILLNADLTKARLFHADLRGANLRYTNLTRADLTRARLNEADLFRANLTRAHIIRAELAAAELIETNLEGANLKGADLSGADLSDARLTGAKLVGAKLTGARIEQAQLDGACGDKDTILPEGLKIRFCD